MPSSSIPDLLSYIEKSNTSTPLERRSKPLALPSPLEKPNTPVQSEYLSGLLALLSSIEKSKNHQNDDATIQAVWNAARKTPEYNPRFIRLDSWGWPIIFGEYGNRNHPCGWEIDHIVPKDKGGSNEMFNLQALNWYNNCRKSNK